MRLSFRLFCYVVCLRQGIKKPPAQAVQTGLPCLSEADELHTVDSTDTGVKREHTAKGKRN